MTIPTSAETNFSIWISRPPSTTSLMHTVAPCWIITIKTKLAFFLPWTPSQSQFFTTGPHGVWTSSTRLQNLCVLAWLQRNVRKKSAAHVRSHSCVHGGFQPRHVTSCSHPRQPRLNNKQNLSVWRSQEEKMSRAVRKGPFGGPLSSGPQGRHSCQCA